MGTPNSCSARPPEISVALKAKQVNVDSLMRRKGEDGVAPARAVTLITRIVSAALQGRESRMAIDVQVWAQPIILGAQTLPDANATLKAAPGAPLDLSFNLGLPGQSRLRGDGDLETGAEAKVPRRRCFHQAPTSRSCAIGRLWARRRPRPRSRLLPTPSLIAAHRCRARWKRRRPDSLDAISS